MNKKLATIILGLATFLIPAVASASTSVWEELDAAIMELGTIDASLLYLDIDASEVTGDANRGHGPGYRPGPPRPHYHPVPVHHRPAPPRYVPRRTHSHRTEIVVVEQQPTTTVVETNSSSSESSVERSGSRFGIGIRLIGNKQSDYAWTNGNYDSNRFAPGFGWYLKYRPIRWVSLEFQNDFNFGKLADAENIYRVPMTLGLQFHVFDYGDFDLYGVAAVGFTIVSFDDCYGYDKQHYVQWGGQFGGGISFILGTLELGFDVRYTVDEAPADHVVYYDDGVSDYTQYDKDQVIHGVTFAINVGFAL